MYFDFEELLDDFLSFFDVFSFISLQKEKNLIIAERTFASNVYILYLSNKEYLYLSLSETFSQTNLKYVFQVRLSAPEIV